MVKSERVVMHYQHVGRGALSPFVWRTLLPVLLVLILVEHSFSTTQAWIIQVGLPTTPRKTNGDGGGGGTYLYRYSSTSLGFTKEKGKIESGFAMEATHRYSAVEPPLPLLRLQNRKPPLLLPVGGVQFGTSSKRSTLTRLDLSPVTTSSSKNPIDLDAWRDEVTVEEMMEMLDTAKRAARAAGLVMLLASNRTIPETDKGQISYGTVEASRADTDTAVLRDLDTANNLPMPTVESSNTGYPPTDNASSADQEIGTEQKTNVRAAPPNQNSAIGVSSSIVDEKGDDTMTKTKEVYPSTEERLPDMSADSVSGDVPVSVDDSSHSMVVPDGSIDTIRLDDNSVSTGGDVGTTDTDPNVVATVPENPLVPVAPSPPASAPSETIGTSVSTGSKSSVAAFQKSSIKDICTVYDTQAQDVIQTIVQDRYPSHSFLGEESVATGPVASEAALQRALIHATNTNFLWICDPIDGTANFASGLALSAVTIAVVYKGTVIVGVVYDPYRNDMFAAVKGQGAYLNDIYSLSVTQRVTTVRDAVINAGCPVNVNAFACSMRGVQALNGKTRGLRMIACSALTTAWIAAGRLTAHFGYDLNSWDLAAGALLIQEAGGLVTDLSGMPYQLSTRNMLCSNGLVHYEILDILQDASAVSFTRSN